MTNEFTPAEVFPPGDYLRDELNERGWTVTEFAGIVGRPVQAISEILNGKKAITTETALTLADALGTSPELWLNLQMMYQLNVQRDKNAHGEQSLVARRARIREKVPLAEARKRGWLPDSNDPDVLRQAMFELLAIRSFDDVPAFVSAAKHANSEEALTVQDVAWIARIRQIAMAQDVSTFDVDDVAAVAPQIPHLLVEGHSALKLAVTALAECGVHVVFCEGLRGGKLDGAVTFLPTGRPVIGLTARGNRFDRLVFAMLHECAHLTLGHVCAAPQTIIDSEVMGAQSDPDEQAANQQVREWLLPGGLQRPVLSAAGVVEVAKQFGVHPGIVAGWVQSETNNRTRFQKFLPSVRDELREAELLV